MHLVKQMPGQLVKQIAGQANKSLPKKCRLHDNLAAQTMLNFGRICYTRAHVVATAFVDQRFAGALANSVGSRPDGRIQLGW
jgi:hypothetical protein